MHQRLISRQPAIPSTKGSGGGSARRGQRLEAKASEQACGADIPWVGNYENARALVKRAEANCLFILGNSHRSYLAIKFPPFYSLGHTDVLSATYRCGPERCLIDNSCLVGQCSPKPSRVDVLRRNRKLTATGISAKNRPVRSQSALISDLGIIHPT